jgi:signal transduction histidine kinase
MTGTGKTLRLGVAGLGTVGGGLLKLIERQAERIRQITGSLLRFARARTGERRPVDLADVARDAVGLVRLEARARNVVVTATLAPMPVAADPQAFEQVIYNLLRNATHAARGAVRVVTTANTLTVEDDGAGIAAAHLPRVFEPFFTTKPPGEGTGLGLSIVHGIVSDHGGTITAENLPEGGARFRITMPNT